MIKGNTKIQLFDAKTGEEVQSIEKHNMITNALNKLVSPPLDYMTKTGLAYNTFLNQAMPFLTNGLGGIMLWEDPIEENPNHVIPNFLNQPIGCASGVYSGTSTKKGTLNENETGSIAGGKRYVWDFGTDRCNGKISAVTLTSSAGGDSVLGTTDGNIYSIFTTLLDAPNYWYFIAEPKPNLFIAYPGPYYYSSELGAKKLTLNYYQYELPSELHLSHSPNSLVSSYSKVITLPFVPLKGKEYIDDDGNFYFTTYDMDKKEYYYCIVDLKTNTGKDENFESPVQHTIKINIPEGYTNTWYPCGIYKDNFYLAIKKDEEHITDVNNPFDILFFKKINIDGEETGESHGVLISNTSLNEPFYPYGVINGALCYDYQTWKDLTRIKGKYISTQNSGSSTTYYMQKLAYTYRDILPYFLFAGQHSQEWSQYEHLFLARFLPHTASINNLEVPVVKTSAQTMKITYEITEV